MAETIHRKLVVVGDRACGKTSLLSVFHGGNFIENSQPTVAVFDTEFDGRKIEMMTCNTAIYKDYDRLRPLIYPDTDVFVMCFSIGSLASFYNIRDKWIGEVPIILVGLKKDLRNFQETTNEDPVTYEQGEAMCQEINAQHYLECSAKLKDGVTEVFKEAARTAMERVKKKKCNIM